ncbi:esterase-like activity of phytase family protein [Chelativorans composti]|jgi:hypothetical protein|uniref:Esterase-like activity of phytase family protein n=1 Tax=Chelativorans composti TaxID=768533 RepID=A0ABW5DJG1_9HYPH
MFARRLLPPLLILAGAVVASATSMADSQANLDVRARIIQTFRHGSAESRFGPLEFAGGLALTSNDSAFGSFSGFRFLDTGRRIAGITDTGLWFTATIERDASFRPAGFSNFTLEPIPGIKKPDEPKHMADAESFAVRGSKAVVGFEYTHRIVEFAIDGSGRPIKPLRDINPLIPRRELRRNRGFEALAFAPEKSPLAGALVVITEQSIDKNGNAFAAILEGPRKGIFTVRRDSGYDPTDAAFLPNGDLLLLERRFSLLGGLAMRLRRIPVSSIHPGAVADGPVILEADMGYYIDNMEGLDVWRAPDGSLMVSLISDDNQAFFQRTVYLEFRYTGE